MDLEQLDAIDTTDKEQIKTLQRWLQTRGMLPQGKDEIDGVWGGRTTEGFQKARQQFVDALNTRRGIAEAEREANDPVNKAINMGIEVAPYASGIVTGTALGHYGFGKPFERRDERQKLSAASLAKRTDIDPGEKQNQLGRMNRRRLVGNVGQFAAPALLGGAGYATQNYFAPMFPEELQGTVRMVGTGENAAAMTLGLHQMVDSLRRGNPIADEDEAKIRSDASRARGGPVAARQPSRAIQSVPAQTAPPATKTQPQQPRPHAARLSSAVEAADAKPTKTKSANYSALKKALNDKNAAKVAEALNLPATADRRAILQRARELVNTKGVSSILLPLAAAGIAYDAVTSDAEAANRPEIEAGTGNRSETGLTSADRLRGTGAGLTAAASVEGGRRLLNNPLVKRTLGRVMPPVAAYDMTRGALEEGMHVWQGGSEDPVASGPLNDLLGQYDMAQVPKRNPQFAPQTAQGLVSQPAAPAPASQPQAAFMRALEDIYAVLQGQGPDQSQGPYTP